MSETVAALVARAREQITNLNVAELAHRLESGPVTLVDIREPEEVQRDGTIPGAVTAPRGMLEFYADPASPYHREEFDPAAPVVLYCAGGARSALAAQALKTLGYAEVAHLDGGFRAWAEQGRPVTHTAESSDIGARFARAIAAKDAAGLRALLADPVDFRALTPGRPWEATSAAEVVDKIILGAWFEPSDHVEQLVSVSTGRVRDREHVAYRLRVRNEGGEFLVEQQTYYGLTDGRISWLRVLCSGFRPV